MSLIILVGSFVSAACAETASVDHLDSKLKRDDRHLSTLLDTLEQIRQREGVASVGIAIASRDGVIFSGGLGVRRLGSRQPADENTWFRLGSITKSFVGLTALRMQSDYPGILDVPINQRIPGLLDRATGGDAVTLAQLLEHTAGLSDLSKKEFDFQGEFVTFKEAIKVDPSTRTLRWPPAHHSSYSNAGYGYAGYLLETVAQQPIEELVHQYVLQPTNMATAGFFVTESTPPLAAGYDTDGKTPIPYWHMLYRSFGGLNATPKDMGEFLWSLLQYESPGVLASEGQRQQFENPGTTLAASTGLEYGYGLGNYHWFAHNTRYHGHGGDADGYLSHYGYSNETGYGYFVVITAFNKKPLSAMRDAIEKNLASKTNAAGRQESLTSAKAIRLSSRVLNDYAGRYVEVTRRFGPLPVKSNPSLTIAVEDGQLVTRYRGRRLGLVAVSEQHFKRPWQPDATYAFVRENGNLYLQGDMGNFRKLDSQEPEAD